MTKILILAIDAANADLLDRWREKLPAITALRERGTLRSLHGLDDFFVGSTWPSLYTGLRPENHGHHALLQLTPGTYEYQRMADGELVRGKPFWDLLSESGHSVAVLDVPLTQVPNTLRGIQTVEWGSHDALYGFRAYPPALEASVEESFGRHPLGGSCDAVRESADDYASFLQALENGVETKSRITRQLLSDYPWDFAIQVFTEVHCAGHQAWHLHEPLHPAHDPEVVAAIGDPLETIYRRVDTAIGEVVASVPPETTIVLLSAHGMSFWYGAQFMLHDVLIALGVTRAPTESPAAARRSRVRRFAERAWMALPERARDLLRPLLRRAVATAEEGSDLPLLDIDPSSSRCFPVINGQPVGGIRFNIAGREPNGILDPGEVDAFSEALTRDLLEITDGRTGKPAVTRVSRAGVGAGFDISDVERALGCLPDLLVHWSDEIPTGCVGMGPDGAGRVILTSPKIGRLEGANHFRRTGEHRPDGFCLVVPPGSKRPGVGEPIRLIDLAPSLTAAYGVELPDADGRVVRGLFG